MRIGMFSDTYVPQRNGVATAVKLYKEKLEEMGHEVFVFVPRYSKDFKRNEKNIIEFPAMKFFGEEEQRFALFPPHEIVKIKKLNLDIVHSHTPFSMGFLAYLTSKTLKLPHVGTYHTMYEHYRHYLPLIIRPPMRLTKHLIKEWCVKLDKVIAPTNEIAKILVEYGVPEELVTVIPTGIDIESFKKEPSWDLREEVKADGRPVLLYVGRLGKEKNIEFLFRVFKRVLNSRDAVLALIGYGPERDNLEELAIELGIQGNVIFLGKMDRMKVIDAYKTADVFVFASYTETQGLVILESMAAGLPVVALGKMGVKDLLERSEGGIMLKDLDEEEFSRAILRVLEDKDLWKDLSEKGQEFVKREFSIDRTAERMLELYENLVKAKAV